MAVKNYMEHVKGIRKQVVYISFVKRLNFALTITVIACINFY